MSAYRVTLSGPVNVEEINRSSPHHMTPSSAQPEGTTVTVITDQSGLLGLIRHLHNLGLEIAAVYCLDKRKEP